MRAKESMRRQRREEDEESVAKQENLKRQTLEYEYQLKASIEQQKINQEFSMQRELAEKSQKFIASIFTKAELDKRETQRQNIVTSFNMIGGQF